MHFGISWVKVSIWCSHQILEMKVLSAAFEAVLKLGQPCRNKFDAIGQQILKDEAPELRHSKYRVSWQKLEGCSGDMLPPTHLEIYILSTLTMF